MYHPYVMTSLALFSLVRLAGYLTDPLLSGREIRQIVGEPARFTRAAGEAHQLKVVTWNIHRGTEFDRILGALQALDADILLLQEVDRFCRRSGWHDVAKDLADVLGMNWVSAGEFLEVGESRGGVPALTGQAVLSKYGIEDPAVIRFAAQARLRWRLNPVQPRRGARIALKARSAGILIYNVHIESGGNDELRRKQLDEVLADQAWSARDRAPVIIAGDFNNLPAIRSSMFGRLTAARFADALGGAGDRRRTSTHHRNPIDWIFIKNLESSQGRVADAGTASDHHPVLATLAPGR